MPTTNPHSIPYTDAKEMIDEYRRFPRPIVGSEDSKGQLIQLDELSVAMRLGVELPQPAG